MVAAGLTTGCQTTRAVFFEPDPVAHAASSPLPAPETDLKQAAFNINACMPAGWPIDCDQRKVISPFGPRGNRMHRGMDIKGEYGVPVRATADGMVVYSGVMSGYGNIVVVDHGNGYQTAYAHLKDRKVSDGDMVARGGVVGGLGRTGRATTHHVHYEVRRSGRAINPMPYVQGDRLVPGWREVATNAP